MNLRHPMGVLLSFSIKNVFYNKMELKLFYFRVATNVLETSLGPTNHL